MVPDPATHATVFLLVVARFWAASLTAEPLVLPRGVHDVLLRADHGLAGRARFHLVGVGAEERVGVWDETPFWVGFRADAKQTFEHGDYRHAFRLFLRSFLRHTRDHASLATLRAIVSRFPALRWECPLCARYNEWSVDFVARTGVLPDALRFLLTHENRFDGVAVASVDVAELTKLMETSLTRFLTEFGKLCGQTSAEPADILANLIRILDGYVSAHAPERLHEFEQECARDMRDYLYREFRFLRTASVSLAAFPRDMMIARDLFPVIAASWLGGKPQDREASPGLLVLLCHVLLEDRMPPTPPPTLLVLDGVAARPLNADEVDTLADHHPLLRQEAAF